MNSARYIPRRFASRYSRHYSSPLALGDSCIIFLFLCQDYELQNWIKDLHDYGYPVTDGHDDHGVPESFTSRQQLCDFLTAIIFTCSCQHAAVNFSQFDVYGFPPNSPAIMRQPPPTKKGEITMENLMECLATKDQAANTIATVYNLTRIFPDEVSVTWSWLSQYHTEYICR